MTDKELIWASALRYAIGRKTYMPHVVCDWFKTHKLSKYLIKVAIEDIERNEKIDDLGHDCDKARWLDLKKYLQEKLNEINQSNTSDN